MQCNTMPSFPDAYWWIRRRDGFPFGLVKNVGEYVCFLSYSMDSKQMFEFIVEHLVSILK